MEDTKNKQRETESEKKFPGAAIDKADGDTVTPELTEQYTCELNNNPRNEGKIV